MHSLSGSSATGAVIGALPANQMLVGGQGSFLPQEPNITWYVIVGIHFIH